MERKIGTWLGWLLAAVLVANCGGGEWPESSEIEQSIINGTPDTSQEHMAVVFLSMGFSACSGTLITSQVVMTAAHCVYQTNVSGITVGFGTKAGSFGGGDLVTRKVSEKWVHPDFNINVVYGDIALLRLSSAPPAGITPIPYLPHSLGLDTADIGKTTLEFVGFGKTETGTSGTKMTVEDTLQWICVNQQECQLGNYSAPRNTICIDQNPGGPCSGDSGGPVFVDRGGKEYTGGIVSFGANQSCTLFGCNTKVDEYEAEIKAFIGTSAEDGEPCSSSADCQSGICEDNVCCGTPCTGACMACNLPAKEGTCSPIADGTSCSDGTVCNGIEVCQGGQCQSGSALNCDDGVGCTTDSCDPVQGCQHAAKADGASCADGDLCNGNETCQGGQCLSGTALNCDDGLVCTIDACDPSQGCIHAAAANGLSCADADVCNGQETCQGGVCQPGNQMTCEDQNPCTLDGCDAQMGCTHVAVADGTACGGGLCGQATCQSGSCVPSGGLDCNDQNDCTTDSCDPQIGCVHDAVPDSTSCGECKTCTAGQCVQIPTCEVSSGGCSCQAGGAAGWGLVWPGLMALALVLRRKRGAGSS